MTLHVVLHAALRAAASAAIVTSVAFAQTMTPANASTSQAPASILPLTIDEAVRRAVEHNPNLAIVRLGVDSSATEVAAARSAYTPLLSTSLGRSRVVTPPSTLLDGAAGINTTDVFSSVGVRQRITWGNGTWGVSWDGARTATDSPFSSFSPSLQSGLSLAFSQPLLRDRVMDSSKEQYIIARRNQTSSDLQFRESVVQTMADVKQAYWTLKALTANVAVQRRSLELAEDLVRQNRARVSVGDTPPLDLVQAEAEVASRRENLIRAEAAAGDAEDRLRKLIMDPSDTAFWQTKLDPVSDPSGVSTLPDVSTIITKAQAERYDVLRAQQDVENAVTRMQFYREQRMPDVRLEASYRAGGLGGAQLLRTGGFPGDVVGRLDSGFSDVLGQLFNNNYPTWSIGVNVSHPLGKSYEQANMARADVERQQATQAVASLQLEVAAALREAARQVQSTSQRIDAARASQDLAEQRVTVEQKRFEAGLSTSFLVTQAQRDLLQAQVNLLQAMLDHQSALVSFEALQLAPPSSGGHVVVTGAEVLPSPAPVPKGMFRGGV
jgi:outer membrane protein TolC